MKLYYEFLKRYKERKIDKKEIDESAKTKIDEFNPSLIEQSKSLFKWNMAVIRRLNELFGENVVFDAMFNGTEKIDKLFDSYEVKYSVFSQSIDDYHFHNCKLNTDKTKYDEKTINNLLDPKINCLKDNVNTLIRKVRRKNNERNSDER